jgi:hypothetical protein
MTPVNSFPESIVTSLDELLTTMSRRVKALELQLAEASRQRQTLNDLGSFIRRVWPEHILNLLKKESQSFEKMCVDNPSASRAFEEIHQLALEKADTLRKRFPLHLEEACGANELPLDRESRDPRYSFEQGFFTLEVDPQTKKARLSDYEGRLDEFPADIGAIVEAVQREHKRVFGASFDGKKIIRKLRTQYLAILGKENWADGYAVPIRRITSRLGKNQKGFRTDVFIAELSRLVEKGPMEIDGKRLDLQQTKDTNQGILLHGAAGRGYVGYITFREVQ